MKPAYTAFLLLALALLPASALGSVRPATLTMRLGFDEEAWSNQPSYSVVPAASATWSLTRAVSLWSGASYFQQGTTNSLLRVIGATEHSYARYVPLSFGLRVHAHNAEGQPRGPFVEFGPSLTPAWYRSETSDFTTVVRSGFRMMGGLQAGTGLRLPCLGGSRAELGLNYYLAEAFGEKGNAYGRIGTPRQVDVNLLTLYLALGIGD